MQGALKPLYANVFLPDLKIFHALCERDANPVDTGLQFAEFGEIRPSLKGKPAAWGISEFIECAVTLISHCRAYPRGELLNLTPGVNRWIVVP
jgi:hypothetical protein